MNIDQLRQQFPDENSCHQFFEVAHPVSTSNKFLVFPDLTIRHVVTGKPKRENFMPPVKNKSEGFRVPVLRGVLPVNRTQIPAEIIAGMTLAALAVPEVMGYTKISGTPVVTGLYTILIQMALFAFFGSSRHLVVGADSATAAILAAGLAGVAATGSDEYLALAAVLALMAAGFLIFARLIGL